MKILSFLVSILALMLCASWTQAEENTLRAGIAFADISPPVGVPLAGYGGGERRLDFPDLDPDNYHTLLAPSQGILDPLISKVLVLESGGTKILIIKLDSIGVMDHMVEDLAKKIQSTGISKSNMLVTGTHTHSGPGAMTHSKFWAIAAVDLFEKRLYDPFIEKLAQLVIQANDNLQPARLGVTTTKNFNLSRNRRKHPGVLDPTIAVFKIEKLDGTPLAVMFNFAIHGTCYGADNMHMSGDVMGFSERLIEKVMLEKKTPVMAMFINGTEGDVAPMHGKGDGAKSVGEQLGSIVTDLLPTINSRGDITLAAVNEEITFPKATLNVDLFEDASRETEIDCWGIRNILAGLNPLEGTKVKIDISDMVPLKFRMQALRIGNSVIACIPGEPLTNIGTMLKAAGSKHGFANTFIFGLANGHMGYICDEENYDEGGYEAMLNLYGRDEGPKIVETFNRLFEKLATK